jgi:hypothetical protein
MKGKWYGGMISLVSHFLVIWAGITGGMPNKQKKTNKPTNNKTKTH